MPLDLSALEEKPQLNVTSLEEGQELSTLIQIESIIPGKYQPREDFGEEALQELSDSIKAQGVIQPIVIRPIESGQYEIIAGERRWRASKLAGKDTVPSIIREVDDKTALEMALIENIQRDDLKPMEEAKALQQLKDEFKLKNKEVADAVGKGADVVNKLLSLLKLPECLKVLYERGVKSPDVLNELAKAYKKNPEETESFVFGKDSITRKEAREFLNREITEAGNEEKNAPARFPDKNNSGSENDLNSNSENFGDEVGNNSSENFSKDPSKEDKSKDDDNEIDQGELTSWPKGKTISDPEQMTKPLLIVEYDGRSASVLLNRRPSNSGLIRIRYEDGGGDAEVDAGLCKINLLTEN